MDNRERIKKADTCHIYIAIKRKKDNDGMLTGKECMRHIIRDEDFDKRILREKCKISGGAWRIYRTVNARSYEKAMRLFRHKLIDVGDELNYKIDSLWKSCLLKKQSRDTKYFLLDIDEPDWDIEDVVDYLYDRGIRYVEFTKSPNGWHMVVEPFNPNDFDKGDANIEIKKDAYIFVEMVE